MTIKVTREQALKRSHAFSTPHGPGGHVRTYIGSNRFELKAQGLDSPPIGPMANLVEQEANSTVQPHFHGVDQFQVFVGGSGRVGVHPTEPVTVHFAGPHSPYGPIVAGPQGIHYLTLRPSWDPGAQWMPESAPQLRSIPNRKQVAFTSERIDLAGETVSLKGALATQVMSPLDYNGAGVWSWRAGPGADLPAGDSGPQGEFWYVLTGALEVEGERLGPGACVFRGRNDRQATLCAGPGGVEALQLRFPFQHP